MSFPVVQATQNTKALVVSLTKILMGPLQFDLTVQKGMIMCHPQPVGQVVVMMMIRILQKEINRQNDYPVFQPHFVSYVVIKSN